MAVRSKCFASVVLIAVFAVCTGVTVADTHPCWIWRTVHEATNDLGRFTKPFQIDSTPSSAQLCCASICARLRVLLDGKALVEAEPYDAFQTIPIASLQAGDHELVVEAEGVTGPSAFFLQLDLTFDDETHTSIISDSHWRVSGAGAVKNRRSRRAAADGSARPSYRYRCG